MNKNLVSFVPNTNDAPRRSAMTLSGLAREISGSLRGQKVAFATICLLVAGMCAVVVITTGRAQAATRNVANQIDAAGSRQLTITMLGAQPLVSPADVTLLSGTDGVQAVIGIGPSRDVTIGSVGPGGNPVSEQPIIGDLSTAVALTAGRWPRPGEGIISTKAQQTLGLDQPVGWVGDTHGHTTPIVGRYTPLPGFEDLNGVLVAASTGTIPTLRLELSDVAAAKAVQSLALSVLDPPDPGQLHITSPTGLAQLQQAVSGDLESYTHSLTLITFGSGIVLILIVVLSQVLLQRKDIGRRRALGAPRWAVIAIVIGQSTAPAALGAIIGTVIATAIATNSGNGPNPDLPAAAIILGILTATIASITPAVLAAWRDPVRVLRTP